MILSRRAADRSGKSDCKAWLERASAIEQAAAQGNEAHLWTVVQFLDGRRVHRDPMVAQALEDTALAVSLCWRRPSCDCVATAFATTLDATHVKRNLAVTRER